MDFLGFGRLVDVGAVVAWKEVVQDAFWLRNSLPIRGPQLSLLLLSLLDLFGLSRLLQSSPYHQVGKVVNVDMILLDRRNGALNATSHRDKTILPMLRRRWAEIGPTCGCRKWRQGRNA